MNGVDVRVIDWDQGLLQKLVAERLTETAFRYLTERVFQFQTKNCLRPVYCPICGMHFTTVVKPGPERVPTVVHYVCADCGGDGRPVSTDVPR
jgi:hypothetical protein